MSGKSSSNTPHSTWTRCEKYWHEPLDGTILQVSVDCGSSTKTLTTVVSASTLNSPALLCELSTELWELWPLVSRDLPEGP